MCTRSHDCLYLVQRIDYDDRWPRVDVSEGATSQLYRSVEACRQVGLLKHKCVALIHIRLN